MMWNWECGIGNVELGCAVGTIGIVGALREMGAMGEDGEIGAMRAVGVSSVECGDVTGFFFFEYLADGEEYA